MKKLYLKSKTSLLVLMLIGLASVTVVYACPADAPCGNATCTYQDRQGGQHVGRCQYVSSPVSGCECI